MWWWSTFVAICALMDFAWGFDYEMRGGSESESVSCEDARLKCAYRVGCGGALQNYMVSCSSVLQGSHNYCPETCLYSLIALTSTEEGRKLMTCECSDDYCRENKRRVEVCRPQVMMANRKETVVGCKVAQWICAADSQCSTALGFYNKLCKSMFHGKKCTKKCKNSISILLRQEQAAKLKTCQCDGLEDFDCLQIQENMARLCSDDKHHFVVPTHNSTTNEVLKKKTTHLTGSKSNSANHQSTSSSFLALLPPIVFISYIFHNT